MKICPGCHKKIDPVNGLDWLPFCSDRCRLIDLGAWLNEDHRIAAETAEIQSEPADTGFTTH